MWAIRKLTSTKTEWTWNNTFQKWAKWVSKCIIKNDALMKFYNDESAVHRDRCIRCHIENRYSTGEAFNAVFMGQGNQQLSAGSNSIHKQMSDQHQNKLQQHWKRSARHTLLRNIPTTIALPARLLWLQITDHWWKSSRGISNPVTQAPKNPAMCPLVQYQDPVQARNLTIYSHLVI